MKKYGFLLAALAVGYAATGDQIAFANGAQDYDPTGTKERWLSEGEAAVKARAAYKPNTRQAKNIILFVGDGMGISTLTAGRIMEGQLAGAPGEENYLSFERFPNTALVKTYNVDAQVADSAGTASALNTGTKTRIGVINTAPTHPNGVCEGWEQDLPLPLANYAEKIGMSTGIVSTARLTHATPAAVYAHSPSRDWEGDTSLTEEAVANGCRDIAQQILDNNGGNGLEVALGGGARYFLPEGTAGGRRKDGRNIPQEWTALSDKAAYVSNAAELAAVDTSKTDKLLGLFSKSHMSFAAEEAADEPTLADMTEKAIQMLSKNEDGFYLMVEAGRIDHGHHAGTANLALQDTVALSEAVKRTLSLVDTEETLIIVTADHSHVFTMAGYPNRGNPILGLVRGPGGAEELMLGDDGKPYTTVGYQNGPGAVKGERPHLTDEMVHDPKFKQQSLMPRSSETHGGEDVAAFAIGPWSHLVTGTMEQNVIFHVMDHAGQIRARAAAKAN